MVTCWERADLLALVGDVYCIFVTFPCGIQDQVWYLIVSFPDLCLLSYSIYFTRVYLPRLPGEECSCDVLDFTYFAIKLLQSVVACCLAMKYIYIYLMPVKTQLLQYMLTRDSMLFYHSYQIRSQYKGNIKQSR